MIRKLLNENDKESDLSFNKNFNSMVKKGKVSKKTPKKK